MRYLMMMMMCVPVSYEQLPLRLLALTVGALLIVLINFYINKFHRLSSLDEIYDSLNEKYIGLLRKQLFQEEIISKGGGVVASSNVISNNLEINNDSLYDSLIDHITNVQNNINMLCFST